MPLISVILPVYNAEKYVAEAVQSILDQTFKDFELLVINDASTDNTLQIIEGFNDSRLKVINNEINLKVVKSLNKGIGIARGEFVARMDADDISYPYRFEKQVKYFEDHPEVDVCGSWVQVFDGGHSIFRPYEKHEDIKASLLFLNNIVHPSVMFRKDRLLKHQLFYDETFTNAEDYGLWVAAIDKLKFANVQEVLLKYRLHNNNASFFQNEIPPDVKEMNIKAYKAIFLKMGMEYTSRELDIHINFGLKRIKNLTRVHIVECLKWLQHLVITNNNTHYLRKQSLRNVIMHQLFYLSKKVRKHPGTLAEILKTLLSLYSITDYLHFSKYILKRKLSSGIRFRLI